MKSSFPLMLLLTTSFACRNASVKLDDDDGTVTDDTGIVDTDDVEDTGDTEDTDDTDTDDTDTDDTDTDDTDTDDTDTDDTDTDDTDDTDLDPNDVDDDNDGFTENDGDCDDTDASINPDANEIANDGIDNDCIDGDANNDLDGDGVSADDDCDDNDPTVGFELDWYLDVDQDGYGSSIIPAQTSCETPVDGNGNPLASNADDCNDTDANVNPGATEVWYDGVDQDCDAATEYDQDGDGFNVDALDCDGDGTTESSCDLDGDGVDDFVGGGDCDDQDANSIPTDVDGDGVSVCAGDCDDNNATVYPGANELLWDGADNDCDGTTDMISSEDYDNAVVGAAEDYLSYDNSLSVSDLNGDGTPDLLVGGALLGLATSDFVGGVHMLDGATYTTWDGTAASYEAAFIGGSDEYNYFGLTPSSQTDMNGDGSVDLTLGGTDGWGHYNGYSDIAAAIFLDASTLSGSYDSSDGVFTFGTDGDDYPDVKPNYGSADVTSNYDIDGDGVRDFLYSINLGGYDYQGTWYNQGQACNYGGCDSSLHIFSGSDLVAGGAGFYNLYDDANQVFDETTNYDYFGQSIQGTDIDGDGDDDLFIASPGNDEEANGAGCLTILNGSTDIITDGDYVWEMNDLDFYFDYDNASICSETDNARLGWNSGTTFGDFNADGLTDMAIAGPAANLVFVFFDAASLMGQPHIAEEDADVVITGTEGLFGYGLVAGDFNGDGADDLAVGSPYIEDPIGALFEFNALLANDAPTGNGMVYLYDGLSLTGALTDADANGTISSPAADLFGMTLVASDMNGDGTDDLWVGAPMYNSDAGRASLYIMP